MEPAGNPDDESHGKNGAPGKPRRLILREKWSSREIPTTNLTGKMELPGNPDDEKT
jgi:hypothetical protein